MKYKFITIEGNIGAGKTTLATKIAADYNGKLILEQFADNPFLPKFYQNPKQHAFPLELFFMAERHRQLKENLLERDLFKDIVVTDYLFIKSLLFAKINLEDEEFKLYSKLFNIIYQSLPQPDLLIYLHCPIEKLLDHINKRGRKYEQNISPAYLQQIQEAYFDYFKQQREMRVVIADVSNINLVESGLHYEQIKQLLQEDYEKEINYYTFAPQKIKKEISLEK